MTSPSARVRESAEFICSRAEYVSVEEAGLDKTADLISDQLLSISREQSRAVRGDTYPRGSEQDRVDWIFVRTAINFCFFTPGPGCYRVKYRDREYSGYMAMCAAMSRAVDQGTPFFRPSFYSQVSDSALRDLLKGEDGDIPLYRERADILREVGGILCGMGGSFHELLLASEGSSQRLVTSVLDKFPSFRDEAPSAHEASRQVCFYKRAQILAADLCDHFHGKGPGTSHDMDELTMFPDYRVPQVLYTLGALSYSPALEKELRAGEQLEKGGKMEQELRASSVRAVELLKDRIIRRLGETGLEKVRLKGWEVNSVNLDYFLWDYSKRERKQVEECIPHHRTITTFY